MAKSRTIAIIKHSLHNPAQDAEVLTPTSLHSHDNNANTNPEALLTTVLRPYNPSKGAGPFASLSDENLAEKPHASSLASRTIQQYDYLWLVEAAWANSKA